MASLAKPENGAQRMKPDRVTNTQGLANSVFTRHEFPSSFHVNHSPAALLEEGEPSPDFMYGSVTLKKKCDLSCSPLSSQNERSLDQMIDMLGRAALINGLGWGLGEPPRVILK